MPSIVPALEDQIAQLNVQAFWKELTFSQNTFSPEPGKGEYELADNVVWLGNHAFALQLKQRDGATSDPEQERRWFKKKVLTTATRQIRDTLRFLREHDVTITNERGRVFDVRGAQLEGVTSIISFVGSNALPQDCWNTRYHVSATAGFIHIVPAEDYFRILETLRVPGDIREYFAYREKVLLQLDPATVTEADVMGAFIADEPMPTEHSHDHLGLFVQDLQDFDISWLIGNLFDHIQADDKSQDYCQIMLEFARVPRSVWRAFKERFKMAVDAANDGKYVKPFLFAFPATDCTFMIAVPPPDLPVSGADGDSTRLTGLKNFTDAAAYLTKTSRAVGLLVSKDGAYFQLDWCRLDLPWAPNPAMDALLEKSNPFRPLQERTLTSFHFANGES
ncbi:hypothetical protein [Rhodoferax sp.]|uniref:hypothetical protein n=1 Tax=Rhodoferax sp. TaxID=50421 RepID=UPI00274601CF|nr:hypothetical protein [Rhodoferax sp.]